MTLMTNVMSLIHVRRDGGPGLFGMTVDEHTSCVRSSTVHSVTCDDGNSAWFIPQGRQ